MRLGEICFWASAICVGYTYLGYPVLLSFWAGWRPARPIRLAPANPSVSVVIAALNEEATIGRRVREFDQLLSSAGIPGEVIVVSDGSSDRTADIAAAVATELAAERVRVIALSSNRGKSAALTAGCEAARSAVVVLADCRQIWGPDGLSRLLENFADPAVGAVSGELILETAPGIMAGVGAYWRYEKWIRRQESRIDSTVGVTGAISAVRRQLFRPIPPGTILDDVYWPLQVVSQGFRVVFDERAVAFDRLPERPRQEFRRKTRTLCGNFQLVARWPAVLLPWRNRIWFQFVSHKLLRLLAPWALLGALVGSAAAGGFSYRSAFAAQLVFYLCGMMRILNAAAPRSRFLSVAGSFLLLNAAAFVAFWMWLLGGSARAWNKTAYVAAPAPLATSPRIS